MLTWVARRTANLGQSTALNKSASAPTSKMPLSARPASHSSTGRSLSISRVSYSPITHREYAKPAKAIKKTAAKQKEPEPIFDEDIEDESVLEAGDIEFEDATKAESKDPEYLQSALQMEEILRNTLPADLVDSAVAEHRRVYGAYKAGKMSESDATRFGFSRRLSPAELKAKVDALTSESSQSSSTSAPASSEALNAKTSSNSASTSSTQPKTATQSKSVEDEYEDDLDDYEDTEVVTGKVKKAKTESTKSKVTPKKKLSKSAKRAKLIEDQKAALAYLNKQDEIEADIDAVDDAKHFSPESSSENTLEAREQRIETLMARKAARDNPKNEPLLHHRMGRLRGIIEGKDEGDPTALRLVEKANISIPQKKRGVVTTKANPDSISKLAREAKDFIAKGKWKEALEVSKTLSEVVNHASFLSNFAFDAWAAKQHDVAGQAAIAAFNMDESDTKANMVAARALLAQHNDEKPDAAKRLSLALQHIDRALERLSDSPDLLSIKGAIYSAMRKYKLASTIFKVALHEFDRQKFPRTSRVPTYRDFGKALAGRGLYKSARKYLELAHQIAPNDVEIISLLAELFERGFSDLEAAAPFYRLAVQTNPEDVPSLVRLGQLFSDPSYSGQNLAQARQCYERAMMLQPLPEFWFPLGWLSANMGEHDRAVVCLQKAAESDPNPENRWTAIVLLAESYAVDSKQGSIDRAIQLYRFALEEKADPTVQLNLAKCLLRIGAADEAEAVVSEIRENDPDNCELKCILVEAYYLAGRFELAHRELDNVIMEHPLELTPQFMKGKYLYEDGDYQQAAPYLTRSVEPVLNPQSTNIEQLKAVLKDIGSKFEASNPERAASIKQNLAQSEGKGAEADEMGEEDEEDIAGLAAATTPEFAPEALYLLSRCHFEAKRWPDAKRATIYALRLDPENARLLEALGEAHLQLNETEDAMDALRKASVLDRQAARPSFRLGNLFAEASQPEQALTYYQRALDAIETHQKSRSAQNSNSDAQESLEAAEEGFSAGSINAAAAAAVPRVERLSEDEMNEMLYAIHSNMSECYKELATHDRANYAKFTKSATNSAQRAQEMRSRQ